MTECYEAMNVSFANAKFSSGENVDYELDRKMKIFSNLSMVLARTYEHMEKKDDALKLCSALLDKQLPSHLKKTFDSIKARITKQVATAPSG